MRTADKPQDLPACIQAFIWYTAQWLQKSARIGLLHLLFSYIMQMKLFLASTFMIMGLMLSTGMLHAQDTLRHAVTFRYGNDFFHATDRYLTQDVTLQYHAPFIERLPSTRLLLRLKPAVVHGSVALRQQCYTPRSIRRDTIFTGERPFAGAFLLQQALTSADVERGLVLTSVLSVGVLGPCALCAEEQVGIHRALDNIEPLGWQFQIANTPIVNYASHLEKRLYRSALIEVNGGVGAEIGTYRTNSTARTNIQVGRFISRYEQHRLQDDKLRFSVSFTGEARAVAYDATMQGALIGDASPYVLPASAVSRVVLQGGWDVNLAYKRAWLSFTRIYLTPEFIGGLPHGWGRIDLRWWW